MYKEVLHFVMNIKKYAAFVRAVELGSLTRAAEEMAYTQSGLSHMMKSLEREFGFPLFVRTPTGIQANHAAEQLLPIVRDLLQKEEVLLQTISSIKGVEEGCVHIAAFTSIAIHWLPPILREFGFKHPNIQVQIREGGVTDIEQLLAEGKVDLAFYAKRPNSPHDWIPLVDDLLMAVLPLEHPLADVFPFPLQSFLDNPFILPIQGFDYDVNRILQLLPSMPETPFFSRSDHVIISMVGHGLGLSILPKLILQGHEKKVKALPMLPSFSRILGISVPRLADVTPATQKFIDFAQDYILQRYS